MVPLQASVNALTESLASFQTRLCAAETLASDNFSTLAAAEKTIKTLKEQNATLMDRVDDLENRSRRANLRILNVPENSEKGQSTVKFVSEMLMEVMGQDVFEKPPELERAQRSLGPKPQEGRPPRPLVICFHRFQEKEKALRWARQNEAKYKGSTLRIYPDISADLARKRATFKNIKQLLYQKNVRFQLLHPARLRVRYDDETFLFNTPEEAQHFYDQRFATRE
ncbi:LINE-1 type transposase domain-containing 1 [Labeo rohita]|uniref:LINE-1 type transposase domain-containing 1 n=1 Tax=Labeo rohita TaxID=84645 RepID=A0A498MH31_LABRO|nr:LINE-1 type transposase domain-containing 1 [Labeo rohita]